MDSERGDEHGRQFWVIAGLLAAIATALRLYALGASPLWYDEVMYAYVGRHFRPDILSGKDILAEPLFASFLALWMRGGSSALWFRLPAAVLGVAAVLAAGGLGKRLAGRRGALVTLAVAAVAPMLVYYSRDGKMYAWVILWQLLVSLAVLDFADGTRPLRSMLLYFASATALCYTHYLSFLFLITVNVGYALFFARRLRPMLAWAAVQGAVIAAAAPAILIAQSYAGSMHSRLFHARIPTPYTLYVTACNFVSGYSASGPLRVTLLLILTGLIVFALLQCRGRRRALGFLLVAAVGQVILLYGASRYGSRSLYIDRYVVGAAGLLLTMASAGMAAIPSKRLRGGIIAGVLACSVLALGSVYAGRPPDNPRVHAGIIPPPDSPALAKTLRQRAQPGDTVLHVTWETQPILRWYAPEFQHRLVEEHGELGNTLNAVCSRGFQEFYGWHEPVAMRQAIEDSRPLWLVLPESPKGLESMYSGLLNTLAFHGECHTAQRFAGESFLPVVLLGYTLTQGEPNNGRHAKLLVSSEASGSCTLHMELRAANPPQAPAAWELAIDNPTPDPQQLQCTAVGSDATVLAMHMRPEQDASAKWTAKTYHANGEGRPAIVCCIHPREEPGPALESTVSLEPGEYAVFFERTLPGPGHPFPSASLQASVAGQALHADGSQNVERGGWQWQSAGQCRIQKTARYPVRVWAQDPENYPEAFGVFSMLTFVRLPTPSPQSPIHIKRATTIAPGQQIVQPIRMDTSNPILVLVGQGQRFTAVWSGASHLHPPAP